MSPDSGSPVRTLLKGDQMNFSIIVPTKGRPTLDRTIRSILHQMGPEDEMILVADGEEAYDKMWAVINPHIHIDQTRNIHLAKTNDVTKNNGASQRDLGMKTARGDVLLFMDDDDIYVRRAFRMMRESMISDWAIPHIFRMAAGGGGGYHTEVHNFTGVLWTDQALRFGNIGTPMVTVPNLRNLPKWAGFGKNSHDYEFIVDLVTNYFGGEVRWHEQITSIIRPTKEEVEQEVPSE
jgi:glycosyltransferase involved in cell wall biosynthesis